LGLLCAIRDHDHGHESHVESRECQEEREAWTELVCWQDDRTDLIVERRDCENSNGCYLGTAMPQRDSVELYPNLVLSRIPTLPGPKQQNMKKEFNV